MKFKPVENHTVWAAEKTNERIELVLSEIKTFNQEMNKINSNMNVLKDRKSHIKVKIANKWKYIKQLKDQLQLP